MSELLRCRCTRVNNPWRRFCGGCGAGLGPACSDCGFVNAKHDHFCGGCGAENLVARRQAEIHETEQGATMPIDLLKDVLPS